MTTIGIRLRAYLDTMQGRRYRELLKSEVEKIGKLPAMETGLRYALLFELLETVEWCAKTESGFQFNIPVSLGIMGIDPHEVLQENLDWTAMDYAPTILNQVFDDCGALEQLEYAFDKWTHKNGEPILFDEILENVACLKIPDVVPSPTPTGDQTMNADTANRKGPKETPEMSFDANAAKTERLAILKAMGTIMAHVSDEDILERWLPWGIEPDMEPEDLEVLLPDFPSIVNHFARLVRDATRKAAGGIDGWLFVEGPEGRNLARSADGGGDTPPDADHPESAGN